MPGAWNDDLFRVLEGFPDLAHDDEVDACNGALEMLNPDMKSWGFYEATRREGEKLQAEKLRASRGARGEATLQPGSMEWFAAKNKSS